MIRSHTKFHLVSLPFSHPYPFSGYRLPQNEPHNDNDNYGFIFLCLFLSRPRDTSRCPFAFLPGKADIRINKRPDRCRGIKVSSPEGVDSVDDESAEGDARRGDTAGLAARINHSFNLREITCNRSLCNRSPRFVISARSAVKRPRCIVVSSIWRKRRQIECFD